jgi:hypothetical protein
MAPKPGRDLAPGQSLVPLGTGPQPGSCLYVAPVVSGV